MLYINSCFNSIISSSLIFLGYVLSEIVALSTYPANQNDLLIHQNSSENLLSRSKRFLVYPGGGFSRFICGFLVPTDIPLYQNINVLRNIQFFYPLPQNWVWRPLTWPGLGLGNDRLRSFHDDDEYVNMPELSNIIPDSSRGIAYEVIEDLLGREGKNGRECMLRAICEVAETPVNHNGIVGELMQVFFTPGEFEPLNSEYRIAQKAGLHHVNCEKLYPDCPMGHGILDAISHIQEFKFSNLFKV